MIGVAAAAAVIALAAAVRPAPARTLLPDAGLRPRAVAVPGPVAALAAEVGWDPEALRRWPAVRAAAGGALVAVVLLVGALPAAALAALVVAAAPAARPWLRTRRRARRDAQLPAWLERLAAGLRAGLSLPGALSASATSAGWPLRQDLDRLLAQVDAGVGVEEALARWRTHPDASRSVALACAALELGAGAGGSVARAVDRVAATLRDRLEAQAEARALGTQARTSAALLSIAPVGFTAALASVEPRVVRVLLTTPVGWACLLGGLALEALGAAWMARIVRSAT